jgi:hypothetical protein
MQNLYILRHSSLITASSENLIFWTLLAVRPGRDADPLPPSSAEVKNRVQLYFYSL